MPLKLHSADSSLELVIDGYQYPDIDVADSAIGLDWDANWLIVRGSVRAGQRAWEFADPCLTTQEASGWPTGFERSRKNRQRAGTRASPAA